LKIKVAIYPCIGASVLYNNVIFEINQEYQDSSTSSTTSSFECWSSFSFGSTFFTELLTFSSGSSFSGKGGLISAEF